MKKKLMYALSKLMSIIKSNMESAGFNRLAEDIKLMTGLRPNLYWQVSWRFLAPAFILVRAFNDCFN